MAALVALWRWEDNWASLPWGKFLLISAFLYGAVMWAIHASGERAREAGDAEVRSKASIAVDVSCIAIAAVLIWRAVEDWGANASSLPFAAAAVFIVGLGYTQRRRLRG